MALAVACIIIGLLLTVSGRFRQWYYRWDLRLFRRRHNGEFSAQTDRAYRSVGIFCLLVGLGVLGWSLR